MKKLINMTLVSFIMLVPALSNLMAFEKEQDQAKKPTIGFIDKNKDGINDKFHDANGDGKNDVDGKIYAHQFQFIDKNKDGYNDVWLDRDGDGVNDLGAKLAQTKQRPIESKILDVNKDGKNDITDEKFTHDDFKGRKFGFIDEKTGKVQGRFMDEDGNGIDDRMDESFNKNRRAQQDVFVDEDGDGICDGRGDSLRRHGRGGSRQRRGKR